MITETMQTYDIADRLANVAVSGAGAFNYDRLPGSDLVQTLAMPNGVTRETLYEPYRNLPATVSHTNATGMVLTRRIYDYDAAGHLTNRSQFRLGDDTDLTGAFACNARSELTNAVIGANSYAYAFDTIGNRLSATENAATTAYLSTPLNQYTAITVAPVTFEPQYDLDGNQTLVRTSTGIWHVSYNAENRPICFSNETRVVEMGCDYQGRRFEYKEKVNGAITSSERYLYRNYLQLAALDLLTTTNVIHTIVWDPIEPVATRPLVLQTPSGWFTYSFDQVKNVTELFDSNGAIAATYDYTPFGAVISATGSAVAVNPLTFSSEIADTTLGLQYYNFRPYNPLDGRWINKDPIGEWGGGLNLYIFVNNRGSARIDFLGLSFKDWFPFINTIQMVVEGRLKSIPGQHSYDYPGVVRRDGCCLNVEEAEAECRKANQDMYLQYLADANKGSLKTRATDVGMMSFLSGLHPWVASAGLIDGLAGMGGTLGIAVDMSSAKKVADAENCNCDKYLIKQGYQ